AGSDRIGRAAAAEDCERPADTYRDILGAATAFDRQHATGPDAGVGGAAEHILFAAAEDRVANNGAAADDLHAAAFDDIAGAAAPQHAAGAAPTRPRPPPARAGRGVGGPPRRVLTTPADADHCRAGKPASFDELQPRRGAARFHERAHREPTGKHVLLAAADV